MAGIGNVRRGDVVTIVLPKDFGKPRPAVVFQSDNFPHTENITVLPITSAIANEMELERLLVEPSDGNGLRVRCQIRIDAIQTVRREKVGRKIGTLEPEILWRAEQMLAIFLGFSV
jgi:mRNA interferase MazF